MSIKSSVEELNRINAEIKSNNLKNRILRTRARELETNIAGYLQSKEQTGLKYNGKAIILEQKEKFSTKNRKDKQDDIKLLFKTLGISDPDYAYEKLLEAQKGNPIAHNKLVVKNIQ